MTKLFKNKKAKAAISICLIAAVLIGGAFALLSAYDSRTNRFTQGTLSLSLTETNWDATNAQNMLPLQTVRKNPQVINDNKDNIPAWVFMSVKVPSTNTEFEDETVPVDKRADGQPLETKDVGEYYDLFTLLNEDNTAGVNTTDWELVAYDASQRNQDRGFTTYYYVYKAGALEGHTTVETTTTDGETEVPIVEEKGITSPLFNEVQLVNIAQRPADGKIINKIDVQGCGIQQSNIADVYTAWAIFANQNNGTNNVSNFTYCNSNYHLNDGIVSFR